MTKAVSSAIIPKCDKSDYKDKQCMKEWARYEAYEVIYKGDAGARLKRISEGE